MDNPAPRRRPLPWGLAGTLVLVAAIELVIGNHPFRAETFLGLNSRFIRKSLPREGARCDILCFGDSMVKDGVQPRILEERLGRRAYNLAIPAALAPETYFIVRRCLAVGARPAAVIVDFDPFALATDPRIMAPDVAEMLSTADGCELGWAAGDAGFGGALVTACLLPSARDRLRLHADLGEILLQGRYHVRDRALWNYWRSWRVNEGAQVMLRSSRTRDPIFDPNLAHTAGPWAPDRVNERFVLRFLELTESASVPVIWLLPPLSPVHQKLRESWGVDRAYADLLRSLMARFAHVTVIDARHAGYPATVFTDMTHLDWQGGYAFTSGLAKLLAEQEWRQKRWLDAPRYQPPPPGVHVDAVDPV